MPLDLFPIPSPPPSRVSPARHPGICPESTKALLETLRANHKDWHIFINDKGFHNHTSHHVLALWALGASPPIIRAAYTQATKSLRPAFESPEPITVANFGQHIGDENYYNAYLEFFKEEIATKGFGKTLDDNIFGTRRNFTPGENEGQPEMLSRFLAGIFHAMIHVGHGAEFGLPGVFAEGLALTAVERTVYSNLISPAFFEKPTSRTDTRNWMSFLESIFYLFYEGHPPAPSSSGVHLFTILARVMKDPRFDLKNAKINRRVLGAAISYAEEHCADAIAEYVQSWDLDTSNPLSVEMKLEELAWLNTVVYATRGFKPSQAFRGDFFFMHCITSSVFLPSLAAYLSPRSQELLLRGYLSVCLLLLVSRGCRAIDIKSFYAETDPYPRPPDASLPHPSSDALTGASEDSSLPNAWHSILQNGMVHPDEHFSKIQRSLAHFSAIYGSRPAGLPDFADTELEGADLLDGSLFIRVAGLTANSMGRVLDGDSNTVHWQGRTVPTTSTGPIHDIGSRANH